MKTKTKKFDVWVTRTHQFIAKVKADTLEEAIQIARAMSIDELVSAPGETIDSEHAFTAVLES